jgi:hypothetical protein
MLFGPETDVAGLRALIEGSSHCSTSHIPLVLYRKDGEEVRCTVRILPKDEDHYGDCTLTFESDTYCCSNLPTQPVLDVTPPSCSAASTSADFLASCEGVICTLLSQQPVLSSDVAIHVRAVRGAAAAAAAAARHERLAGQARPE